MILSITLSADWIQKIIQADQELFLLLNKGYTNSFLDAIFPWYREGNAWVPFHLFLVVFSILNFGKKAFPFILFAVITIVLTDQISSSLDKPFFERPRPCRDPYLMNQIRMLLNGCSGRYSFTSSHATNHFGFAVYLLVTIGSMIGKSKYLLLVWAATIAYGQVYVGVHYPLDIFFGALLGSLIGWITGYWHNRTAGKISLAEIYNTI